MMDSPFCAMLSKASWVITALAAINQGMTVFGFNVFMTDFFLNNLNLLSVILLVIGAAGVWSFARLFSGHGCSK